MRFVALNRGGLTDDHGTNGYVMKRPGAVAIRAGYTDLLISYDGERLTVESYYLGDTVHVWDGFTHTDDEIRKWGTDEEEDYEIHDETPPDFGPPGSGSVITEYEVGTYNESW